MQYGYNIITSAAFVLWNGFNWKPLLNLFVVIVCPPMHCGQPLFPLLFISFNL